MKIFIDSDGVLASFVDGVFNHYKCESPYKDGERGDWDLFQLINKCEDEFWNNVADESFWATLPKTPEADEIVELAIDAVGVDRVAILTAPPRSNRAAAVSGKLLWFEQNYPHLAKNVIPTHQKHFCAGLYSYLIDDNDKNCEKFTSWGGEVFLFPRPWNAKFNKQSTAMNDLKTDLLIIKKQNEFEEMFRRANNK